MRNKLSWAGIMGGPNKTVSTAVGLKKKYVKKLKKENFISANCSKNKCYHCTSIVCVHECHKRGGK